MAAIRSGAGKLPGTGYSTTSLANDAAAWVAANNSVVYEDN